MFLEFGTLPLGAVVIAAQRAGVADRLSAWLEPFEVCFTHVAQRGAFRRYLLDARVIAATNLNLQESVTRGTFREDLYFRLAVVVVKTPALRERDDDVSLLAPEFLNTSGGQQGKAGLTFTPGAARAIVSHSWPGNVRELQNRVQRAVIIAERKRVTAGDLELGGDPIRWTVDVSGSLGSSSSCL